MMMMANHLPSWYPLDRPVTLTCCDAPGSCPEAGIPTRCSVDCAEELQPFTAACSGFLALGVNSGAYNNTLYNQYTATVVSMRLLIVNQ